MVVLLGGGWLWFGDIWAGMVERGGVVVKVVVWYKKGDFWCMGCGLLTRKSSCLPW